MYPTGRHSPAELLRVMLGQLWTLPGRRAPEDLSAYDISPARVEPHLVAVSQPRSAYCEQFRSLRTRILQAGERLQMRAIVVTSAGIAEGKTLTALNLAWLLAQTEGVRALVIDSDLRHPCATDYLGIDATDWTFRSARRTASTWKTQSCVSIRLVCICLPGGKPRDDVAELLSGPSYARLLTEVRRMFDYIIIDAPPLGIFTDANVLMNRADGALLGRARRQNALLRQSTNCSSRFRGRRLLGVVLNRAEEQPDSTSYYYQHRYYNREQVNGSKKKALPEEHREEEVAVVN